MLLAKMKIRNYLSVNGSCEIPFDPRVSVLLGANDHGKSNLLRGLQHLNADLPISQQDENWDQSGAHLEYVFRLSKDEADKLEKFATECHERYETELGKERGATEELPPPVPPAAVVQTSVVNAVAGNLILKPLAVPALPVAAKPLSELWLEDHRFVREQLLTGKALSIIRDGVGAPLIIGDIELNNLSKEVLDVFLPMIPRVELFESLPGELQDSVTASQIEGDAFEFLQGVFFYAGLNPMDCQSLFVQDDATDMRLEKASSELDIALRTVWGQGRELDLHFQLKHRGASIEFMANDPAVKSRKARMSKRSTGVTQFFKLSMVLHARRKKNPANSYIYVFDEPGVFLHPKGQRDLLSVFEQLSDQTQIVFATHSLFMLNQNYPERHRLVTRDGSGTVVDAKPYRANWRYAVDALGVRLTANILFSPKILLVEGDSDPIYIYELFRTLNQLKVIDADSNVLGILSYSDLPNLRFLIQTFKTENDECKLAILGDGDKQGKAYIKEIGPLTKRFDVTVDTLDSSCSIEDYCLHPNIFLQAVEMTLRASYEAMEKAIPKELKEHIDSAWRVYESGREEAGKRQVARESKGEASPIPSTGEREKPDVAENAGQWFKNLSKSLLDQNGSSKVALARNYASLVRSLETAAQPDPRRMERAKKLADGVIQMLGVPSMKARREISET